MMKQEFYDLFSNLMVKCSKKNFYLTMSAVAAAGSQIQHLISRNAVKWEKLLSYLGVGYFDASLFY